VAEWLDNQKQSINSIRQLLQGWKAYWLKAEKQKKS